MLTLSGEKNNFTNWAPGEPDGRSNYKSGEQYAELLLFDSYNRDPGMWGDNQNNKNIHRYGLAEIKLSLDFEHSVETSASLTVNQVNDGPELTGTQATLDKGKELKKWINLTFSQDDALPDTLNDICAAALRQSGNGSFVSEFRAVCNSGM